MPHKLTPHTKEKSSTLIKVCVVEISLSTLTQRKVLSRLWKSVSLPPYRQNVFETGVVEGQCAAPLIQGTLRTLQKQWAFWSHFPTAPPHLDSHLTQPSALLPTLPPTVVSPAHLPYLSLHSLMAKACWCTPVEEYFCPYLLLAGGGGRPWHSSLSVFLRMLQLPSSTASSSLGPSSTHTLELIFCGGS